MSKATTSAKKTTASVVTQRVLPLGNGWIVKGDTNKTFTVVTTTQREAISIAKSLAQQKNAEVVIHDKNGRIKETFSYEISGGKKR